MAHNLIWLKDIKTPGIELGRIEILSWVVLATFFTITLSLGDGNGLGIYQQPDQSLAVPLILGSVVNGVIIYLLGIRIVPYFYLNRRFFKLFIALLVVYILSVVFKTLLDLLLIQFLYPELKHHSINALVADNLYFCLAVLVIGIFFGVYKSLIYQSRLPVNNLIAIPSGKKLFRFKKDEIDYFEAQGNYVKIVGQFKPELLYISLSKLEKRVDPRYFTRVHRSYIVSMRNASQINKKKVIVDEKEIPVGKKYQNKIKKFLSKKVIA